MTELIWEVKTSDDSIHNQFNSFNWYDAQDVFIATLISQNFGGYSDWRLPNRNELLSIADYSKSFPAINPIFFNSVSYKYWSSTTDVSEPILVCLVDFDDGSIGGCGNKTLVYGKVIAVRGRQCGSLCPTETLYGEHSKETEALRYFRDNVLAQSPEGQEIIRLYYEWSPEIVKAMEEDEEFKEQVKEMIDGVLTLMGKWNRSSDLK